MFDNGDAKRKIKKVERRDRKWDRGNFRRVVREDLTEKVTSE